MRDENQSDDIVSLLNNPLFKVLAVMACMTAFSWGIFLEVSRAMNYTYLGIFHFRNNLGLLTYSLTAMLPALLSATVMYRGRQKNRWSVGDTNVFYGGLLLSMVLLLAGFEYLVFGEWGLTSPFLVFFPKNLALILLIIFLIRIWKSERGSSQNKIEL